MSLILKLSKLRLFIILFKSSSYWYPFKYIYSFSLYRVPIIFFSFIKSNISLVIKFSEPAKSNVFKLTKFNTEVKSFILLILFKDNSFIVFKYFKEVKSFIYVPFKFKVSKFIAFESGFKLSFSINEDNILIFFTDVLLNPSKFILL